ncbi:GIY-YIG nuclease family protein [Aggregatimonas sangjinii]|uniref:GIY-YIG nuclease family protein n=1 Tax=Aggregatimonas sangjinii TaxID=2583587 RepID=A0A5B7SW24_9FLAO|nr:GIY-YIG nuclease family protein [Aggregatimonas sangjinii]QCX02422.1 GIY-YIG nuclease family protein [Aggregatimonas sangjinii]
MFFVYVIFSDDFNRFYVGMSKHPHVRLNQHNSGKTKSTKPFVPWRIIHLENYELSVMARKREKYLKSAGGRKWRKNNIDLGD